MKMLILLMVCLLSGQTSPPVSEQGLKPVPDTVGSVGAPIDSVAVTRCEDLELLIAIQQADIAAQQTTVAAALEALNAAIGAYNTADGNYRVAVLNGDPHEALGVIRANAAIAQVAAQAAYDAASVELGALIDALDAYIAEWNLLECVGPISPP